MTISTATNNVEKFSVIDGECRDFWKVVFSYLDEQRSTVLRVCKSWNELGNEILDPSIRGNKAITWAAKNGDRKIVNRLLADKRIDPTVRENEPLRTAIGAIRPIEGSHPNLGVFRLLENICELLKDERIDCKEKDVEYSLMTWMIYFTKKNRFLDKVLELLKTGKIDPTIRGNDLIVRASEIEDPIILVYLLSDKRSDPVVEKDKQTPLSLAVFYGRRESVVLLMKDERVPPLDREKDRLLMSNLWTLTKKSLTKDPEFVLHMIDTKKVDFLMDDNFLLLEASKRGCDRVVSYLLNRPETDPSFNDNYSIIKAIRGGHWKIAGELLLDPRIKNIDSYRIQQSISVWHRQSPERDVFRNLYEQKIFEKYKIESDEEPVVVPWGHAVPGTEPYNTHVCIISGWKKQRTWT